MTLRYVSSILLILTEVHKVNLLNNSNRSSLTYFFMAILTSGMLSKAELAETVFTNILLSNSKKNMMQSKKMIKKLFF